jgi:D-alanyl-D-alanine-carboxypeptidase/D-alanyl-D-alanine-endopeptidase
VTTSTRSEVDVLIGALVRRAAHRYVGLVAAASTAAGPVVHGAGHVRGGGHVPDATSVFQIGSVTKVFTALLLADAVVRGEISLDTPLVALVPEARPARSGTEVTLAHLASHTAGLPRLPPGLLRTALQHRADPYREVDEVTLLSALARTTPRREPGSAPRYSNFGAALLGLALSRRAGLPYDRLVSERIAGPLGLVDTGTQVRADQQHRRADGHSRRLRPVVDWELGAMSPAGGLWSTAADLLLLAQAHLQPDRTPIPEALRLAQQPQVTRGRWHAVALGWHLTPIAGTKQTALWHNGGTGGFSSYVGLLPEPQVAVVVLTNTARPVEACGIRMLKALATS